MSRITERVHGVIVDSGPQPLPEWNDQRYFDGVARTLEAISRTHIGGILLRYVARASRTITVRPDDRWSADEIAETRPVSQYRGERHGILVAAGGTGQPDDAAIDFLPYFQGPPPPDGQDPIRGVGGAIDEALFEEVTHGYDAPAASSTSVSPPSTTTPAKRRKPPRS